MQEYYIRKEGDEDSRGPFTLEQLSSLVEAGQVDRQTFFYDAVAEKWVEVQSSPELVAALFPVKKKLTIRSREAAPAVAAPKGADEAPITVEQMLAAAEGRTEESRHKRDQTDQHARAALWGLRSMAAILLVSSAGLLMRNMETLSSLDFVRIATAPQIVFGVFDLLLALLLFLELTSLYGLARFRAAVGFGFFAVTFAAQGQPLPIAAVAAGSVGLVLCSLVSNLWAVIAAAILGLAGMGAFAYILLS